METGVNLFVRDFNSIKVRLEPDQKRKGYAYNRNFNSIKVRLERLQNSTTLSKYLFQFHKGAIRTNTTTQRLKLYPPFQFHKGAIRTSHFIQELGMRKVFQFHKGAIRTI